jgi:ATP-dependent Lhr-like helicase
VVLMDGAPVLYMERGGKSLLTLRDADPGWCQLAVAALANWVRSDRGRRVTIERVDGVSIFGSPLESTLLEVGFFGGLRGMELRGER